MASFHYIARNLQGQRVTGVLQAASDAAALRALDDRKLFPVQVTPAAEPGQGLLAQLSAGRVRASEVGAVYSQLADLLGAGLPLLRALSTLTRTNANPTLVALIQKVHDDVAAGKSLADAMSQHPKAFTQLHCAMLRAGERGGFVEQVLTNLSTFIERQDELRGKVRGAMIYPALLVFIGSTLMAVALIVMVPKFRPMFEGFPLPLPSRVLFAMSTLAVDYWPMVLAVTALLAFLAGSFVRSETGFNLWERWRLRIPFLGRTMTMVAITRLCRILGTMLANGVPILQALAIARDAAGSLVLAECVDQAAENVRKGQPLTQPLRDSGLFPGQIVEMIAVAEESNQLEKVLSQIADTVERRTNREVDNAVRLIEPAVLLVVAVGIGFVAVGLLYPIFTMAQTLR
jgi:general secretion pathway protein F